MGRTAHVLLQVLPGQADLRDMRVERVVIEAGENTFTLDLHPRLTVVAGMGRVERDSLIGEIVGDVAFAFYEFAVVIHLRVEVVRPVA